MFVEINPSNGVPIYLQIINQIKYSIAAGALKSGDQIPAVRELAAQIRVNPNTVAKAYTELQRQKVVVARRGEGSFVSDHGPEDIGKKERARIVSQLLDNALVQALHFDMSPAAMEDMLHQRLQLLRKRAEADTKKRGGENE